MRNLKLQFREYSVRKIVSEITKKEIRNNPDMNRAFLSSDAHIDEWIGCYINEMCVGAILCTWAQRETQHMEIHIALDRKNHKIHIPILSELAVLWCLMQGWRPCAVIPNELEHIKKWLENRHSLFDGIPLVTEDATVYTVPEDWTPLYFNDLIAQWS